MAAKSSTLATIDRALDGQISILARRRRSEGRSAAEIRDELRDALNVTVSERSVQRYLLELAPEPTAEAS